jgi:hypothetical protein
MKRIAALVLLISLISGGSLWSSGNTPRNPNSALLPNSLCRRGEKIIFSCQVRGAGRQATGKIASLCASANLTRDQGYLQYRFGLPRKIELEFPRSKTGTQQLFQYSHYMRFQVDLTEVNFSIDDYDYQIFDTYKGEERPAISEQGVSLTRHGSSNTTSFKCRSKAVADYGELDEILKTDE